VLGGVVALGVWLVLSRLAAMRRVDLAVRVLPYVRDLPQASQRTPVAATGAARAVFGPVLRDAGERLEGILGGATSVRRRLDRAGIDKSVHEFRIEQVIWGLVAFGATAGIGLARSLADPGEAIPMAILCLLAFILGVLLCDNRLSARVRARERQIMLEFPVVAELLALAVAAGEGPVAALDRVVRRSRGALSVELGHVLAQARTGVPVGRALDDLARRTGLPLVARFAEGIGIAIERGTPLADVLHAQAADVREAARRELIETGARKEVLMMVPVVFLVLPVTVVFAFWPGVVGLRLVT
jgi:tight adherence protein C